ncbi:MAG: hypothetical protein K1X95_05235 [Acidimicrobiia bacterium]|nr:hypothetical protein [Acidimicrobiia bacterium]
MRTRVILVLVAAGLVGLVGACSRGTGAALDASGSNDVQQLGDPSQDVSNSTVTTTPDTLSDGSPQGSNGKTSDSLVPPEQFPNETIGTEGSKELPPTIPGYNFREINPGDQIAQAQPGLAGAEVTVRILDPLQRTGESYHPTILVVKTGTSQMAGQIAQVFAGGPWQGTEKEIEGHNVWVNGDGPNTEIAWVKKSDTVIMITGAPYSVLEPIMASIISLET